MSFARILLFFTAFIGPTLAYADGAPLKRAMIDVRTDASSEALFWLAMAVVAMVVALYMVHRSVFPKHKG